MSSGEHVQIIRENAYNNVQKIKSYEYKSLICRATIRTSLRAYKQEALDKVQCTYGSG